MYRVMFQAIILDRFICSGATRLNPFDKEDEL